MSKKTELSVTDQQNAVATAATMLTQDRAQAYEAVGMIKAFNFVGKLVSVTEIKLLAQVKDSKQYKDLSFINPKGELVTVTTWEAFCNTLGVSREKIDQDILNLNTLGEDFLETSQRIGLGYRDLRKLRALPDDTRETIINGEAIKIKDKDELVELIEDLTEKHLTEKTELTSKLESATKDKLAQEKIIADKDKKINQLTKEDEKKKLELGDIPPELVKLQTYQNTWGSVSGKLQSSIHFARQTVEQVVADDLPITFEQQLTIEIVAARDMLNELLDMLPDDVSGVDTSWLKTETVSTEEA